MEPTSAGVIGLLVFLGLMLCGLPVGISMGLVGAAGTFALLGGAVAWNNLPLAFFGKAASWDLTVLPMFLLMGYMAFHFGIASDVFDMAYKWTHKVPGSVAVATLLGGGIFGAVCGSSIAGTVTLGKLALPEMKKFGYSPRLAAGSVASAGTLSALIPPSVLVVLYGSLTQDSIGRLLFAILIPGILLMVLYIVLVVSTVAINPKLAGASTYTCTWKERLLALRGVIAILVLFAVVFGGIFAGTFTATEGGAIGALMTLIIGIVMRKATWSKFKEALFETLKVNCGIFVIIMGASVLVQFFSLTRLPINFSTWATSLPVPALVTFAGFVIVYLILGLFLDGIGMLMLTIPFVYPTMMGLGFSSIWLCVVVVELIELGLLTPPVAVQAFALKAIAPDLTYPDIFVGFVPFFAVSLLVWLPLMYIFPQIATYLPSLMMRG